MAHIGPTQNSHQSLLLMMPFSSQTRSNLMYREEVMTEYLWTELATRLCFTKCQQKHIGYQRCPPIGCFCNHAVHMTWRVKLPMLANTFESCIQFYHGLRKFLAPESHIFDLNGFYYNTIWTQEKRNSIRSTKCKHSTACF